MASNKSAQPEELPINSVQNCFKKVPFTRIFTSKQSKKLRRQNDNDMKMIGLMNKSV